MSYKTCDGVSRRDCLTAGVFGMSGLTLPSLLRLTHGAEANKRRARADSVLFINLEGGVSHLDTLDMKPEAPAETRGEFGSIPSRLPGLAVCEHMPKFAAAADRFTLIRGISHSAGAHPQAQQYISTGNRPSPALVHPSLGAVAGKQLPGSADIPPYVAIPKTEWSAGYLGDAYAPLKTNAVPVPGKPFEVRGVSLPEGLTVDQVRQRQELLSKLDRRFRAAETNSQLLEALDEFGKQAYSMITSKRARAAFDVSQEPTSIAKLFAADEFNQSLLLGARLIEFGVRFVTVSYGGWDTHLDNFNGHKRLIPPLDAGLPAVVETLEQKGLLERTLVVAMGEFGRTPVINPNVGRDHYPRVNWCLMAGAGVRPGQFIGASNKEGTHPTDDTQIKPDDLVATIYHALGIDPLTEFHTNTGRPVMLVPQGRVMTELFG